MFFKNESFEKTAIDGEICICGYYHKYWISRSMRIRNEAFDMYSSRILDLKDRKEKGVEYFFNLINDEIEDNITICVVPSHNANNINTGIKMLGRKLAASNNRIDKVDCLKRIHTIDKLAQGGSRNLDIHYKSINLVDDIKGNVILLVDDVTTSGNSLIACKNILLNNGAEKVAMLALGQSI